jgi:hypothetical protein
MAWKWFVQTDETVEGPFTTEEVQSHMQLLRFNAQSLIWGPGTESWQNLNSWHQGLSTLDPAGFQDQSQETWHYAANGQSKGPMTREALIDELKALSSGDVMLWTKGMKEWAPLYEFHDLLTEVGINKRQFPRADLHGKAILKGEGTTLIAPLVSVSEGGFGVAMENGAVAGELMSVELQSTVFREPLHCKAEVRYIGQGVMGFKFTHINVES